VGNQCLLFLELLFSHKCWDFSPKKWGPTVSWWTWGANDCCEIHAFFTAPSMGGRGASFTLFGLMESTNCVFEMGRIAFVWREPYQLLVSFVNQCLGKTITGSFLTLCFEHIFVGEKKHHFSLWSQQEMLKHHELSSIISGKMAAWQPVCFSRGP